MKTSAFPTSRIHAGSPALRRTPPIATTDCGASSKIVSSGTTSELRSDGRTDRSARATGEIDIFPFERRFVSRRGFCETEPSTLTADIRADDRVDASGAAAGASRGVPPPVRNENILCSQRFVHSERDASDE